MYFNEVSCVVHGVTALVCLADKYLFLLRKHLSKRLHLVNVFIMTRSTPPHVDSRRGRLAFQVGGMHMSGANCQTSHTHRNGTSRA